MSTQTSWRRVDELFHGALEVFPPAERDAWLEAACGGDAELKKEVLSLLAADRVEATHVLASRIASAAGHAVAEPAAALPRARVGPYKLIRVIGEGGMGTVFLAERDDGQFDRTVAVKLVRRGMDTQFILARFRRERQILARLDHPNIGRLLDGGATEEGSPFFVMEYIDGSPITDYCDEMDLSVKDRLRLFLEVCAAVQHAHTKLVVHRDIKPGNILVDRAGCPKLLDFGICKLLYREPGIASLSGSINMRLMTPEYASPEQVTGDAVTVASDVYALGGVLYRLLTGLRPHRILERSPRAVEEAVCLTPLVRPSAAVWASGQRHPAALARELEGDLDEIVARAMEKAPDRRYASVDQLAADIRCHLEDSPVSARPQTAGDRWRRLVRRNGTALLIAAAVILALAAGLALNGRRAAEARHELEEIKTADAALVARLGDVVEEVADPRVRASVARRVSGDLDAIAGRSWGDVALELALARAYLRIGELVEGAEGAAFARSSLERSRGLSERVLSRDPAAEPARALRERALARLAFLDGKKEAR